MHEFPLVHKIHKFDHGDDLVIMAMTDCWSFMIAYIIMSSWNISWPLIWGSGELSSFVMDFDFLILQFHVLKSLTHTGGPKKLKLNNVEYMKLGVILQINIHSWYNKF